MDVGEVAKSSDFGKTFHAVNSGLANHGMSSLAVDVKNPDIAYALTEGGLHRSSLLNRPCPQVRQSGFWTASNGGGVFISFLG